MPEVILPPPQPRKRSFLIRLPLWVFNGVRKLLSAILMALGFLYIGYCLFVGTVDLFSQLFMWLIVHRP